MKRIPLVLGVAVLVMTARAQDAGGLFSVTAGMGIDVHSAPSVADYVNLVTQAGRAERFDEFSSAVEFFIVPEIQITDDWSVGIEYSVLVNSHAVGQSGGVGGSEFSYTVQLPMMVGHYLVSGTGYRLKFGGGIGYAAGELSQQLFGSTQSTDFSSRGWTAKLEAVGNTEFDEHFYGSIGVDLRWIAGGVFRSARGIDAGVGSTKAKMDFFNLGLKFGVVVRF